MSQKLRRRIKKKLNSYKETNSINQAKKWLNKNLTLVKEIFENNTLRDFIFEPFQNIFVQTGTTQQKKIQNTITLVAVVNMVLAGLPGKMGIGVFVSIGLEGYMAFVIAKEVGIKITHINDIWKYLTMTGGILLTIIWGFKHLLGLAFSLFSSIPFINPLIPAELFVTNLIGIVFIVGFEHLKKKDIFKIPLSTFLSIRKQSLNLFKYQINILKNCFNHKNIKKVYDRLKMFFKGEISIDRSILRGEIFPMAVMIYLIQKKYSALEGPLSEVFIDSIRRTYSNKLEDASLEEMSEFFKNRSPTSLEGDINLIKGEMREHLGALSENADNDSWQAQLHADRTVPGSDAVFTNVETGETIRVSYKSTDNPLLIETALEKYPEIPIIATEEMKKFYGDHPMISFDGLNDKDMTEVTQKNFEQLATEIEKIDVSGAITGAVACQTILSLYPFVIASARKNITMNQLKKVFKKALGEMGVSLASRMSYAVLMGPLFIWYLLARSVVMIFNGAVQISENNEKKVRL